MATISKASSPYTLVNDSITGLGPWVDNGPDGALISGDGKTITFEAYSGVDNSYYARFENFGFSIPSGAVIQGIQVDVVRLCDPTDQLDYVKDANVRLEKSTVIQSAEDKADTTNPWPLGIYKTKTYGGPSDLWSNTWSYSDLNDIAFGFCIRVQGYDNGPGTFDVVADIDQVLVTVYYIPPNGTTNYGIKISRTGFDVNTATIRHLTLSTNANMLKASAQGTGTLPSSGDLTVAHNLGYKPNFLVFAETGHATGKMRLIGASVQYAVVSAFVDDTNLTVRNHESGTKNVYYYIFHDPI